MVNLSTFDPPKVALAHYNFITNKKCSIFWSLFVLTQVRICIGSNPLVMIAYS
jgi:hypothetical protein